MIVNMNEINPQKRFIEQVCDVLRDGGVIIYPTDTVYAYGCDIYNKKAIEKIYRLKRLSHSKPLAFIFCDISMLNDYVRNISKHAFKIMKKALPGPYTFIFQATRLVPKIAITNQKTIGIRIPDNAIALDLVKMLGRPIISASVNTMSGEYVVDPKNLEKVYYNDIDIIIDTGPKISDPSTIVDFTGERPVVLRKGKGEIFF